MTLASTPLVSHGQREAPSDDRFQFAPYPNAWVAVALSHELKRGQVVKVQCLGRELVLFRGDDGAARLLDAFCPHLGAHLGVGGTVVGNELRCPFHGWRFDGQGACTHIDYAPKIPPTAKLRAWPTQEVNGFIMVWHDAEGRAPSYPLPTLPEFSSPEWTRPRSYAYTIKTRWRELVENAVDRAHFFALHRYPQMPELDFQVDGHRFTMTSRVPWKRFGQEKTVRLDIEAHGPGLTVTRGDGAAPFVVVSSTTPLDRERICHRMQFMVSKRIPLGLRGLVTRLVIQSAVNEFERDVPIWENKRTLARPVLCGGDGPIPKFRAWAAQFSPAEDRA
jgi:3-ketosteroid 9alpha-monooxygenase subunit A